MPFKEKLEKRATKQEWFELQQAQEAYSDQFASAKIAYSRFLSSPAFWRDANGTFINNALFAMPTGDRLLLSLLNSPVCWTHLTAQSTSLSGGFSQADAEDLETLPIPDATPEQKATLGELAEAAQIAAEQRYTRQQSITRRIPDIANDTGSDKPAPKLSNKLKEWWLLPDFAAFQKEVKKTLKVEIPLKERTEWEDWITETRGEVNALTAEITRLESEINTHVYALFDLTPDEISLLEANI